MGQTVSREQIARAKEVNIEDYILSHEPNNIKRIGRALYLKDHDSLEISNGLWNWHSQGIGGKNVIDYLIKVRGYDFVGAVRHLAGDEITPTRTITPKARAPTVENTDVEREPFRLPRRYKNNNRVIEYLQSRGIDEKLILDCIRRNVLYESADFHNAIFIGRDERGKARFAAIRATVGDLKQDVKGSDKRYGFCLPPISPNADTVAVFESPIDALSHKILEPKYTGYRLSLGCTALAALTRFLDTHKEITNIIACTDNDAAGNHAAEKIAELQGYTVTRQIPDGGAKDWNDALILIRNEVNTLDDVRKDIRFIDSSYNELFRVKDGDSIKFTNGYDGEVKTLKCRFIDEAHLTLIGKYHNDYHICELAEMLERNGSKCEAIPGQKPTLNIIAAKYGEPLQDVTIPMTEAAIRKLVGGKYVAEPLYVNGQGINGRYGLYVHDVILRGKDGIAVCGMEGDKLSNLHPYWAQKYKREIGIVEPPKKPSILNRLEEAKAEAAAYNAASKNGERPKVLAGQEV